ncbi:MAG: hypothetical protein JWL77_6872, partial [Chthonomonadaceae bacterium]|nr:hypothetical protein [Chthonomonadaceae bacterium]
RIVITPYNVIIRTDTMKGIQTADS